MKAFCLLTGLVLAFAGSAMAQAVDRDVPYGTDPAQRLDLYHPVSGAPARLVLFIHGGGWVRGRKAGAGTIAQPLTAAGYAVAAISYRLYPQATPAGAVQDAADAAAYLLHNAPRFRLDPKAFAVMGHSSGAHMAALLGTDDAYFRHAGVDPAGLRAVITLDGVFDLAANIGFFRNKRDEPADGTDPSREEQVFGTDPSSWAKLSPVDLLGAMRTHPRFCLVHEDRVSRFIEQEGLFEAALKKHGETVQAVVAPGLSHVQLVKDFADPSQPMAAFTLGCLAAAK